jgi:hypothetical protein
VDGQCDFWNEFKNKCELRKFLNANRLEHISTIEQPFKKQIETFCKTKESKNCWKRKKLRQMINDMVFDDDLVVYPSIRQILWKWMKLGVKTIGVGAFIFVAISLLFAIVITPVTMEPPRIP